MRIHLSILIYALLGCMVLLGPGCGGDDGGIKSSSDSGPDTSADADADATDDSDDEEPPPVTASTPKLSGKWSGSYGIVQSFNPQQQSISATISQQGSAVIINTTLTGAGATLTGTIEPSGAMRMTDPFDGETWTTYWKPATSTHVQLADFLYDPELGAASPLQVIDLTRGP